MQSTIVQLQNQMTTALTKALEKKIELEGQLAQAREQISMLENEKAEH